MPSHTYLWYQENLKDVQPGKSMWEYLTYHVSLVSLEAYHEARFRDSLHVNSRAHCALTHPAHTGEMALSRYPFPPETVDYLRTRGEDVSRIAVAETP